MTEHDKQAASIDQFHKHELMDRAHCIQEMFHTLVADHPAAHLVVDHIQAASDAISALYQAAGDLFFTTEAASQQPSTAIARSKRILALVDEWHDKPTRDARTALRVALMDEFEAAAQPQAAEQPVPQLTEQQINEGLRLHRLATDTPSQLSDSFRNGMKYAARVLSVGVDAGEKE